MCPLADATTDSQGYGAERHNGYGFTGTVIGHSAAVETDVYFILRADAKVLNITVEDQIIPDVAYYVCIRPPGGGPCTTFLEFRRGVTSLSPDTPILKGSPIEIGVYLAYMDADGRIAGATTGTIRISY